MKRAVAALIVLAAPALADERPVIRPTRDVDVTYVATVGGTAVKQRTRTAANAGLVRIDTPSPGLYMIVHRDAHTMDMVSQADRGVIQLPYDPARAGGAAENATYRRLGTDTVDGLACTEWATTDNAGRAVAACFTADGVLLRARAGATTLVQATAVIYGPLAPSIFTIPADYTRRAAPSPRGEERR